VMDQTARDTDEPVPQDRDRCLASADTVPCQGFLSPLLHSVAVSSWSQAAMFAASSAACIHAVLISLYPLGKRRSAAPCLLSRKMFSGRGSLPAPVFDRDRFTQL
jgi:hypothetical protein